MFNRSSHSDCSRGSIFFLRFPIFLFNGTPPSHIYTLSLHDALPISPSRGRELRGRRGCHRRGLRAPAGRARAQPDRKSTRLNSSHLGISYAVFCLKKKKQKRCEEIQASENKLILTIKIDKITHYRLI